MPAGGENGFNQAIELSADTLANVKFVQEKRLISKFFDEISQDTSKYVFGVADTLQCLEMGAVETLVVWEDLQVYRYTLMNSTSGKSTTVITNNLYLEGSQDLFNPVHLCVDELSCLQAFLSCGKPACQTEALRLCIHELVKYRCTGWQRDANLFLLCSLLVSS